MKSEPSASFTESLMEIEILYQDDSVIAVNKPPGMLVHRSGASSNFESPPLLQLVRDQIGRYVYPVHRLDQPTSGIILFGLNKRATANLVEQFSSKRITKVYQAFVLGNTPPHLILDHRLPKPLQPSPAADLDSSVEKPNEIQSAKTLLHTLRHYRLDWTTPHSTTPDSAVQPISLVELAPHTGRFHQLRRHMQINQTPILGDYRYGDIELNQYIEARYGLPQMFLAACYIEFRHPDHETLIPLRLERPLHFVTFESQLDSLLPNK